MLLVNENRVGVSYGLVYELFFKTLRNQLGLPVIWYVINSPFDNEINLVAGDELYSASIFLRLGLGE